MALTAATTTAKTQINQLLLRNRVRLVQLCTLFQQVENFRE